MPQKKRAAVSSSTNPYHAWSGAAGAGLKRPKLEVAPFIRATYNILNLPDEEGEESYEAYIRWSEDGTAVLICDDHGFASEVLPKFFKHQNISSFIRQLNIYGFHKTKQDPQWKEFQNDNFQRGKPELLGNIRRRTPNHPKKKAAPVESVLSATKGLEAKDQPEFKRLVADVKSMKAISNSLATRLKSVEADNKRLLQKARTKAAQSEKFRVALANSELERQNARKQFENMSARYEKMNDRMNRMYTFMYMIYNQSHLDRKLASASDGSDGPPRGLTRKKSLTFNELMAKPGLLANAPSFEAAIDEEDSDALPSKPISDELFGTPRSSSSMQSRTSGEPSGLRRGESFQVMHASTPSTSELLGGRDDASTGFSPAVKRQSAKTLAQHTLPPPKGLRVFTSTSSDGLGASIGSFGMSSFTADDIDKHLNEFSSHEQKALSRMSTFEETLSREYSDAGADLDYSDIPIFDDDEEFVSTD